MIRFSDGSWPGLLTLFAHGVLSGRINQMAGIAALITAPMFLMSNTMAGLIGGDGIGSGYRIRPDHDFNLINPDK